MECLVTSSILVVNVALAESLLGGVTGVLPEDPTGSVRGPKQAGQCQPQSDQTLVWITLSVLTKTRCASARPGRRSRAA